MACNTECQPGLPEYATDLCQGRINNMCGAYAMVLVRSNAAYSLNGGVLELHPNGNTDFLKPDNGITIDLTDSTGRERQVSVESPVVI